MVYWLLDLQHQYLHDNLTNLPNRTLLRDRLQQAILSGQRDNKPLALLMMDLDRFKELNDSLGHYNGDLVLQEMAARLRAVLRQSDTVARLGGDEFAFLLLAVRDQAGAIQAAEKIMSVIEQPLTLEGQTLHIKASLGVALFPADGEDADSLICRADMAMYAAKSQKTGYAVYQPELEQYSVDRFVLQTELRRAIQADQLILHYQPKVDLKTSRIHGVEALVRWQHPKRGLMFPDDFVPLAEETGLMNPLTYWVLRESLRQCRIWHQAKRDLTVSVNISMTDLQDSEFPQRVAEILQNSGVTASFLELEITETAIMANPARAIRCITQLSEMGIKIAIDDFGIGYSSMSYLKKLPVSKIKVDKSFVMDMATSNSDAVIVRSIIGLGHNLGLHVVAEGVENQEIWEQLKKLDCDSAQGYGISRPVSPEKFDDWLQELPWAIKGVGQAA